MAFIKIPSNKKISVGDIELVVVDYTFKLKSGETLVSANLSVAEVTGFLASITDEEINATEFVFGDSNRTVAVSHAVKFSVEGASAGTANITISVDTSLNRRFVRTLELQVIS